MSDPRCSGCGKTAAETKKMLPARSGPEAGIFICDACIEDCAQAIADAPTRIPGAARACSFCSKSEDLTLLMIAIGQKMICDECVDHYKST